MKIQIQGPHIIVTETFATCFGGSNDPQDNGETASGISTKNPTVIGCALPMRRGRVLAAAPLPFLGWGKLISVSIGGKSFRVPVIDLGPALHTGNGIDLTVAAARLFDPRASAVNFREPVTYRIPYAAELMKLLK